MEVLFTPPDSVQEFKLKYILCLVADVLRVQDGRSSLKKASHGDQPRRNLQGGLTEFWLGDYLCQWVKDSIYGTQRHPGCSLKSRFSGESSARRRGLPSWGRVRPPRRWRGPPSSSSSRGKTCSTWCSMCTRRRRNFCWRCPRQRVSFSFAQIRTRMKFQRHWLASGLSSLGSWSSFMSSGLVSWSRGRQRGSTLRLAISPSWSSLALRWGSTRPRRRWRRRGWRSLRLLWWKKNLLSFGSQTLLSRYFSHVLERTALIDIKIQCNGLQQWRQFILTKPNQSSFTQLHIKKLKRCWRRSCILLLGVFRIFLISWKLKSYQSKTKSNFSSVPWAWSWINHGGAGKRGGQVKSR